MSKRFDSGARLVTLVGAPGIGKTRLASRWLRDHVSGGGRGHFCDLRAAKTTDDLCTAVASAIDAHCDSQPTRAAAKSLGRVLRTFGDAVIVLDNFEQLDTEATHTVGQWLDAAPQLRALVTSRVVLRLRAEWIEEVHPLPVPLESNDNDTTSVQLFVDRATSAEPSLEAEACRGELGTAIVRRLEGIPLAIELAAGQLRRRSLSELLGELETAQIHLASLHLDADPRHQTLRVAIEASWRLLSEPEQIVLAELSVFRKGFNLDAAQAVLTPSSERHTPRGTDLVTSLREASLLHVATESNTARRRWDLFVAVREFASERLEAFGKRHEAERRHAHYFLEWGEERVRQLTTSAGIEARKRLSEEADNLRSAWTWLSSEAESAQDPADLENAVRMALVLSAVLGRLVPREACEALTRAIDLSHQVPTSKERNDDRAVFLLVERARLNRGIGQYEAAAEDLATTWHLDSSPPTRGEVELEEGLLQLWRGDIWEARRHLEAALKTATQNQATHLEARAQRSLAWILAEGFRDPVAFSHHARAIRLFRETGDRYEESVTRQYQAIHKIFFRRAHAGDELRQQLHLAREARDRAGQVAALVAIGWQTLDRENPASAHDSFHAAAKVALQAGLCRFAAAAEVAAGIALDEMNESEAARRTLETGAERAAEAGDHRTEALARVYLAGLAARLEDAQRGETLLTEAEHRLGELGDAHYQLLARLQHAQIKLSHARIATAQGQAEAAKVYRRTANEIAAEANIHPPRANNVERLPLATCSSEARSLLRLIDREMKQASAKPQVVQVLLIQSDGSSFRLGDAPPVTFERSPVMRRVLCSLATKRTREPGTPLPTQTLLDEAWPQERIHPEAGSRRVREIVLRLRRAGLRNVLLTSGDGYLLDPHVRISIEATSMPDGHADKAPAEH